MVSVLVVDDEKLIRDTLLHYVPWHSLGIGTVFEANDGKQALEMMQKTPPDIVVTDIKMPHMDGIALAQRVRECFPSVKKFMLGRPLMANPELVQECQAYEACLAEEKEWRGYHNSMETLKKFHDRLLQGYLAQMNGDGNNVLFKMKELWGFMNRQFPEEERLIKKMIKAKNIENYEEISKELFDNLQCKVILS